MPAPLHIVYQVIQNHLGRFAALLCLFGSATGLAGQPFNALTNYKSGISLILEGEPGVDYVFERWYHDPLIDDHGTVYLKEGTRFRLEHNERYEEPGNANPPRGIIRYKVDRDLAYGQLWSARFHRPTDGVELPAYTAPLSFKGMTYAPEFPDVPVVGTTGPVPGTTRGGSSANLCQHWYRGLLDPQGNEWHTITVGTDQSPLMDTGQIADRRTNMRMTGKDGKIHYFVVNPEFPVLWFTKTQPEAEWYTTPAKAYFIPRVHQQISYITDGVALHLANITSAEPIIYRLNGGEAVAYTGPISASALKTGSNRLEYSYKSGKTAFREIIKNPAYPSDQDNYADGMPGNLLWRNKTQREALAKMLKGAPSSADDNDFAQTMRSRYQIYLNNRSVHGNGQEWFENISGKGLRFDSGRSTHIFANALVTLVDGLAERETFAHYAKRMLLENELSIDPVGYELDMNFMTVPSHRERIHLGYYVAHNIVAMAHTYQVLKHDYRPPVYTNGFTAIEDIKVRDLLAGFILLSLHDRQGQLYHPGMGISMVSRQVAALVCALAIPSYNTHYYGTSGFDGTPAGSAGLPFPDQKVTWKELFYLDNVPMQAYPNQVFKMGVHNNDTLPHDLHSMSRRGEGVVPAGSTYGNIREDGISAYPISSIGYNSLNQMGFVFGVYSNIMRLNPGHGLDLGYLDRYFLACLRSEQPIDRLHNRVDGFYPNPFPANLLHPKELATLAFQIGFNSKWDPMRANPNAAPYYMLWVDPGL